MSKVLTPDQISKLKEPLPSEAIKPHPTKTYLSSIKAIYVVERLNEVFGLGGWKATNEVVKAEGKWVVVKATFEAHEYGIVIPDIFGGNDNADLGDAYKGACTDALTKIGSYLYIGMDVYKGKGDQKQKLPNKEKEPDFSDVPDENERKFLRDLCHKSDLTDDEKAQTLEAIDTLKTYEKYQYIQNHLEDRQPAFNTIPNPSNGDITKHLKRTVKA